MNPQDTALLVMIGILALLAGIAALTGADQFNELAIILGGAAIVALANKGYLNRKARLS